MASWRAAGLCLCLLLCACERAPPAATGRSGPEAAQAAQPANETARALRALTEAYDDAWLALNPLAATAQGDHRFDDRFGDYVSLAWMADSLAIEQRALEELAVIDPARLDGEDLLTYEAFDFGQLEVTKDSHHRKFPKKRSVEGSMHRRECWPRDRADASRRSGPPWVQYT